MKFDFPVPGGRRSARERGFTIIETVSVMTILGSLAMAAVPTYFDIQHTARVTMVMNTAHQYEAGMRLARSRWFVTNGGSAVNNLAGIGNGTIDTNTTGWPVATDSATAGAKSVPQNDNDCAEIFRNVFQGAPAVVVGDGDPWVAIHVAAGGGADGGCRYDHRMYAQDYFPVSFFVSWNYDTPTTLGNAGRMYLWVYDFSGRVGPWLLSRPMPP